MDVCLRLVGARTILPSEEISPIIQNVSSNLGDMTNPIRRSIDKRLLEHHLWFKCEAGVPLAAPNKTFYDVGNLVFDLKGSPGYFKYDLDVLLNLRTKKIKKHSSSIITPLTQGFGGEDDSDWTDRHNSKYNQRDDYAYAHITGGKGKKWEAPSKMRQSIKIVEQEVDDLAGKATVMYLQT